MGVSKSANNTTPDHDDIYLNEAKQYHALIAKQPLLDREVEKIRPYAGLDIVDMGAGTGRLTVALAPRARSIVALDASEAMLQVTADRLTAAGLSNWETKQADHRSLPLADRSADLIVSGWSICYLTSTNVPGWDSHLPQVMSEIRRVLRPGGTAIIFETMGTGCETPQPPSFLQSYYAKLTEEYDFSHKTIRLDYTFDSLEQAEQLSRFFFGNEVADQVAQRGLATLPECAGIWWLHV